MRPGKLGRHSTKDTSTIAIYNARYNRTVVYLHTAPITGLSVGQTVSRGQRIGTESWRGVSTKSDAHALVEMRVGKKEYAAVSVGDSKLDNRIRPSSGTPSDTPLRRTCAKGMRANSTHSRTAWFRRLVIIGVLFVSLGHRRIAYIDGKGGAGAGLCRERFVTIMRSHRLAR